MTKEQIQALVDQMACGACFDDRQIFYAILERLHSGVPVTVQLSMGDDVVDGTEGSVLFLGPGGTIAQDNANFFYDDAANQLIVLGSVRTPTVVGGAGVTDALILKGTSGNGTSTAPAIRILVGNNGGTAAVTVLNSGDVGFGTTTPEAPVHVVSDASPIFERIVNGSGGTGLVCRKARGTVGALATVIAGDVSASLQGRVYTTSYTIIGNLRIVAETVAGANSSGRMEFMVADTASTLTERMRLTGAGRLGIGTTGPDKILEVNLGTSDAFRLTYNDSNGSATTYMDTTVSSVGLCTFTAAGSAPGFAFSAPARLKGYTVATLPAGAQGDTAFVTDATAPTYLGALVGGGAVVCPVFHNGSAWVSG